METRIEQHGMEIAVVRLVGKFTIEDVNDFKALTAPLAQAPVRNILVSCRDLKFIDSSAIGALILLTNKVKKQNIGLILYDVDREIANVFKVAYLEKFFRMAKSEDLAISFPGIPL
ncbi:MAG: STAS domain-containing protein [Spirochaetes bacterium]|nr:STAS domain-containing protein [Spirochaetota bacterium]